jgi:hypothetical protein
MGATSPMFRLPGREGWDGKLMKDRDQTKLIVFKLATGRPDEMQKKRHECETVSFSRDKLLRSCEEGFVIWRYRQESTGGSHEMVSFPPGVTSQCQNTNLA